MYQQWKRLRENLEQIRLETELISVVMHKHICMITSDTMVLSFRCETSTDIKCSITDNTALVYIAIVQISVTVWKSTVGHFTESKHYIYSQASRSKLSSVSTCTQIFIIIIILQYKRKSDADE